MKVWDVLLLMRSAGAGCAAAPRRGSMGEYGPVAVPLEDGERGL
jgi:hypothetical protein